LVCVVYQNAGCRKRKIRENKDTSRKFHCIVKMVI